MVVRECRNQQIGSTHESTSQKKYQINKQNKVNPQKIKTKSKTEEGDQNKKTQTVNKKIAKKEKCKRPL